MDTQTLSGVGALGAESITIMSKVNPKQIWALGYDVEAEGRELAARIGFTAETTTSVEGEEITVHEIPEKTLEEEGVVTEHMIRKWLPKK